MPYSLDLRQRVITAVDENMHINEAVKTFKVSRRVIYEWLELRKETGSLEPKSGYQKGHSHKIREYRTYIHIATSYGLAESNAYETIKWVENTLIKHPDFRLPGRKALLKSDHELSSKRTLNEHIIGRIKRFKIVADKYRNRRKRFGLRFNLISAICNLELAIM